MSNVYCKDCSYFVCDTSIIPIVRRVSHYFCEAPQLGKTVDYIHGDYKNILRINTPNYPNNKDTNGCTYYKRKWWKFWRKE